MFVHPTFGLYIYIFYLFFFLRFIAERLKVYFRVSPKGYIFRSVFLHHSHTFSYSRIFWLAYALHRHASCIHRRQRQRRRRRQQHVQRIYSYCMQTMFLFIFFSVVQYSRFANCCLCHTARLSLLFILTRTYDTILFVLLYYIHLLE